MSKTASLVIHAFGEESYVNRLAQEVVPVHHALTGYDKTVLLRHETDIGPFELSEKAEKKATVIDLPTKENLAKYLNELGDEGYVVDLYIFSHGWTNQFQTSKGTYGDNTTATGSWLEANIRPLKLRMVWGTICYGSTLNDTWTKLGAKVCAGARFVNFFPTGFKRFVKAWNGGATYKEALLHSGSALNRFFVQVYLIGDAIAQRGKWGGTFWEALTVMGNNEAAQRYFQKEWIGDDWTEGKSGGQNMNISSEMLMGGNAASSDITKNTVW